MSLVRIGAVLLAAGSFLGNTAVGYVFLSFMLSYGTNTLKLPRETMLGVVIIGSVCWLISILYSGWIADRIGARKIFIIGYSAMLLWSIPYMMLVDTANVTNIVLATIVLTITLGLSYGAQSALFAALFPARVRYSGASLAYATGAILGGGFAPVTASFLVQRTHTGLSVGIYMALATTISLISTVMIRPSDTVWMDR